MKTSLRITVIYLIIGIFWILASDKALLLFFDESQIKINYFQTIKGIAYVIITALIIYLLINRYQNNITKKIDELNRLNSMLQDSNKQLEQFAYVASHDLQEPLRMITGFLSQLEKKYNDKIDDRGKQYIHFAVDGAKRMRQIILDLLDFSRVGKEKSKPVLLDVNEVISEATVLLRNQIASKKASIHYKNLPEIVTYHSPLIQVFQNLIGNALKYSKEEVAPIIEITAEEQDKEWKFAVKDNGIGISQEFNEKIFIIFQRLHHKSEYSGTGMGLAIVKKIIEGLGGKIWVESEEGKGSTFYFTILKNVI